MGRSDASKDRHATEAELIDDVFFFNAMGEDEANGVFSLRGDELDLADATISLPDASALMLPDGVGAQSRVDARYLAVGAMPTA